MGEMGEEDGVMEQEDVKMDASLSLRQSLVCLPENKIPSPNRDVTPNGV